MAEKKIGDVVIGIIIFVFMIGSFSFMIGSFDNQFTNSDNYSAVLSTLHDNASSNYELSEVELSTQVENGSFTLVDSNVDIRGSSEVALIAKNSPSTIKNFISLSGEYLWLNKYQIVMILSLIITVVIILTLRFFRPGGA